MAIVLRAAIAVLAGIVAAGAVASDIQLPDPSTGSIDGMKAALVWPARYKDRTSEPDLLPAKDCRVMLASAADRDALESRPCGVWFRPQPGTYKVWLEGPAFITPFGTVMRWEDVRFDGGGFRLVFPVVPAGSIVVGQDEQVPEHANLRLFALDSRFFGDRKMLFDRRIADAHKPTAVPAGLIVAGWFDRRTNNAIALTRPVSVGAGKTVSIRPAPPASDSDVIVILQRPVFRQEDRIELFLQDAKVHRPPDVFAHGSDSIFAVWYGVTGKTARLTTKAEALHLEAAVLNLTPRTVTTYRARMTQLPRLSIRLDAPHDAFRELSATVHRLGVDDAIQRVALKPGDITTIDNVPVGRIRVILQADRWELTRDVVVHEGEDAQVDFTLRPIVVRGTVYEAADPAPAMVSFYTGRNDEWITTQTNDAAQYSITLWEPAAYIVRIDLLNDDSPPFVEVAVDAEHDTVVDFHVPRNAIRVSVTDAVTGAPISNANVMVASDWEDAAGNAKVTSNRYETDDKGTLRLPRLHAGRLAVGAVAPGYEEERRELEIDETTERQLAIPLKRANVLARVRVHLPDGMDAAGAEACLVRRSDNRIIWRGTATADGLLEITGTERAAVVVIRHPRAASAVRELADLAESLALSPAGPPLVLRTTDGASAPTPFALVSVWIDGVRLTNTVAAFATWSAAPASGRDALWSGRNLPPGPVRVLVTRRVLPPQIASGAYDALACTIAYPWQPHAIDVPAAK